MSRRATGRRAFGLVRCSGNPHWQKVAERVAEGVHESLQVTDVQPNHGWCHLWREIVRSTKMKPELCDYMCGHEGKSGTSARYGKRKVPVLAKEMALFPRFTGPTPAAGPPQTRSPYLRTDSRRGSGQGGDEPHVREPRSPVIP
jgi:hypothetical protein